MGSRVRPLRAEGQDRRLGLLRRQEFRAYWLGSLCSSSGTWLQTITGSILMLQLTGSPFMVGLWNFASFIPLFVLTPVGGVLGDRWDRRTIVIVTHVASAGFAGILAVLTLQGLVTPTVLLAVGFVMGCLYSVAKPALSALFYPLVPESELARASAANTLQFNLGQLIGAAAAAVLTATLGPGWAFGLNALTFLAMVAAMLRISAVPVRPARNTVGLAAMREGFKFVAHHRAIRVMLLSVALISGVTEAIRTLSPDLAAAGFDRDVTHGGTIVAFYGVGAVVGLLGFGWLHRLLGSYTAVGGYAVLAVSTFALAVAPTLEVGLVLVVPAGIGFAMVLPLMHGQMQQLCPEHLRSRVMGAYAMALLGMRPAAAVLAGGIAGKTSSRWALVAFSAMAVAGCAWSFTVSRRTEDIVLPRDRT